MYRFTSICSLFVLSFAATALAGEKVRMASSPSLSSDGSRVAFAWRGDLWIVAAEGGTARRLTANAADDASPRFSPDGRTIAFVSDRRLGRQVWVVPAEGGEPRQLTFDTNGTSLLGWYPDGQSLLVSASTDRYWRRSTRLFRIRSEGRGAPEMLFDAYGGSASLSPDGARLLFTRGGVSWARKGYRGSQASQIWLYDTADGTFTEILHEETGSRYPLWLPDGETFLYVGAESGALNLMRYDLGSRETRQITRFPDDSVVSPTVSADGTLVVFRHLFDLYRMRPGIDAVPQRMEIEVVGDRVTPSEQRRVIRRADGAAFSADGLEVAMAAGGDLWVMDTVLREPVRVTKTPEEERSPVFSADGEAIFFVGDSEGQGDLWKAERADEKAYWWRNREFRLTRLTESPEAEFGLTVSPAGDRLAFIRGRGDLVVTDLGAGDEKVLVRGFTAPQYDWSPDGRWIAYATNDVDFNVDVWIVPADGSAAPVNVSRHPDDEGHPSWSPDGRLLAFTGKRWEEETDVHYVWLRKEDDEETKRDRTLEEALEKMQKGRKDGPGKGGKGKGKGPAKKEEEPAKGPPAADPGEPAEPKDEEPAKSEGEEEKKPEPELPEVVIDFDGIQERIQRIDIPGTAESNLFWSPDSKKIAFTAEVDGRRGTFTMEIPGGKKAELLTSTVGSNPRWIEKGNRVLWLVNGLPTTSTGPKSEAHKFSVKHVVDRTARQRAAFDMAWRLMRDHYYDGNLGNRNWDEIRRKYSEAAATAPDRGTLARIVNLMLGELNGSHLGFSAANVPPGGVRDEWSVATAHLGLRWDPAHRGPGLRVLDVIPESPADRVVSRVAAGETVLEIDGTTVDPQMDLTLVLNGPPDRDIRLKVRNAADEDRDVVVRPIALRVAQRLLYRKWQDDNRAKVAELSAGALGYLHIRGMSWTSFQEFQRELYDVGYGKDGLVIDVRNNGGGFTTDHLLTCLTQPVHAITVQRGGGPGYPQDRKVYASWHKPIVVLCNESSFSNAEIFSHAIKTLRRGKLVGVPTAGGVISTGGARVMDLGWIRMPSRGWFILGTGEDMELNGAVPDFVIWPRPGDLTRGVDEQLAKAVEVLLADVAEWTARPRPKLRKASER